MLFQEVEAALRSPAFCWALQRCLSAVLEAAFWVILCCICPSCVCLPEPGFVPLGTPSAPQGWCIPGLTAHTRHPACAEHPARPAFFVCRTGLSALLPGRALDLTVTAVLALCWRAPLVPLAAQLQLEGRLHLVRVSQAAAACNWGRPFCTVCPA